MAVDYQPKRMTKAETALLLDEELMRMIGQLKRSPNPRLERDVHTRLTEAGFERRVDRERLISRLKRNRAGAVIRKG